MAKCRDCGKKIEWTFMVDSKHPKGGVWVRFNPGTGQEHAPVCKKNDKYATRRKVAEADRQARQIKTEEDIRLPYKDW